MTYYHDKICVEILNICELQRYTFSFEDIKPKYCETARSAVSQYLGFDLSCSFEENHQRIIVILST